MISAFATIMLASAFFLNPPATCSWAYAELQPSSGEETRAESCGVLKVSVLSATTNQLITDGYDKDDAVIYRDFVKKLENRYCNASYQERAALCLEFINLRGVERNRQLGQTWIKMDSLMVHYLTVTDGGTGNSLMKLEDETTGQYIGFLIESRGGGGVGGLVRRFLDSEPGDEERAEIIEEIDQAGEKRSLRVDVNGVVMYIDRETLGSVEEFQQAFSVLWGHLPEGDGKHRIEMAIPVIWKAIQKEDIFSGVQIGWATNPEETPHDLCLILQSEFIDAQRAGDLLSMETPPEEILKDFFGKPEMPLPDPNWSFKKLKKKML